LFSPYKCNCRCDCDPPPSAAAKEAQTLLSSINNRHAHQPENQSQLDNNINNHIKSTKFEDSKINEQKNIKIEKLNVISKTTNNATEKKISKKTREILIKSSSLGNSSTPAVDRMYLSVNFLVNLKDEDEGKDNRINFFFKKNLSLGEMLFQMGSTFASHSYGQPMAPDGLSLTLSTEDSPDWKEWDRSKTLEILLEQFEEVSIDVVSTVIIVQNQKELEVRRIENDAKAIIDAEVAARAAMVAASDDELVTYPLSVGEVVEYYPTAGNSFSREGEGGKDMELVTIISVHQDDFPNLYYTLRFNAGKREKQTDRFHLRRRPGALKARLGSTGGVITEVEGGVVGSPMALKINHGGKMIDIVVGLIGDRNTVDGLKGVVGQYTGVPLKSQKLVYKGVVLKDGDVDLKTAKLANGSKVTLIGTATVRYP